MIKGMNNGRNSSEAPEKRATARVSTGPVLPHIIVAAYGVAIVLAAGCALRHSAMDIGVTRAFNGLHKGIIGAMAGGIYRALEPIYALVLLLAVTGLVGWVYRNLRASAVFFCTVAVAWLPVVVLKIIFMRPRPLPDLLPYPSTMSPRDWSFPSGHTAFITAFVVALFLVMRRTRLQIPVRILGVAGIVAVTMSVLIIGVHFPTDVVASLVWSGTVAPAAWAVAASVIPERSIALKRAG